VVASLIKTILYFFLSEDCWLENAINIVTLQIVLDCNTTMLFFKLDSGISYHVVHTTNQIYLISCIPAQGQQRKVSI
jgi:hypothetical protein